jgi:lysyl-tRNA synthetase class 2
MLRWQPSADLPVLRQRAAWLAQVRSFFAERGVLEVDPPLLARSASTDPALTCFATHYTGPGGSAEYYLQTSPEAYMKRLLAAGSGAIYALTKVFRDGELGRWHNPEFTLLEWYRPGLNLDQLMAEVVEFVGLMAPETCSVPPEQLTYQAAFERFAGIDPHTAGLATLRSAAQARQIVLVGAETADRRVWLDLLLTHCIEPQLGQGRLTLLTEYPADQAALARVRPGAVPVAERFELYWQGVELANGFYELADADEQARRFAAEQARRVTLGLPAAPADQYLLAALAAGLPDCSGVALGFDRLLALALGVRSVAEVLSFSWDRC